MRKAALWAAVPVVLGTAVWFLTIPGRSGAG